eukprot:1353387-Pleurochrysis_carterae.AAC.1
MNTGIQHINSLGRFGLDARTPFARARHGRARHFSHTVHYDVANASAAISHLPTIPGGAGRRDNEERLREGQLEIG